jgi:hypothetical protein
MFPGATVGSSICAFLPKIQSKLVQNSPDRGCFGLVLIEFSTFARYGAAGNAHTHLGGPHLVFVLACGWPERCRGVSVLLPSIGLASLDRTDSVKTWCWALTLYSLFYSVIIRVWTV